jgi:hypothetical protein
MSKIDLKVEAEKKLKDMQASLAVEEELKNTISKVSFI